MHIFTTFVIFSTFYHYPYCLSFYFQLFSFIIVIFAISFFENFLVQYRKNQILEKRILCFHY
ncbi:hypothetical protein CUM88_11635 [Enterococcus faecium]|nr:hypothetical protein DPR13_07570 [Enterococcus faecium]RIX96124.1 hypothetical protein D3Y30_08980 [Enterococcus faecium TX1330]TXU25991.1 hypothetical protein D4M94_11305 [Enterococcus sp. T0168A.B-11]HBR81781.1 hypothetical protein [Enterococcus sp.]AYA34558.1 hypothetical protein CTI32_09275 [Enterococcus faecium]